MAFPCPKCKTMCSINETFKSDSQTVRNHVCKQCRIVFDTREVLINDGSGGPTQVVTRAQDNPVEVPEFKVYSPQLGAYDA